ncbi:MAG TPA: hypothetical protein PKV56_12870 [Burkholderiaceae bacterium]|nr:hypothetical protein [Burkholderiaceae bacterium]
MPFNVGVQPPPKVVGWNNGLACIRTLNISDVPDKFSEVALQDQPLAALNPGLNSITAEPGGAISLPFNQADLMHATETLSRADGSL